MNTVFLRRALAAAFATTLLAGAAPAFSTGAVKGAVVGAAAGHFVGNGHAKAGAVVGAVAGHQHAAKKAAKAK